MCNHSYIYRDRIHKQRYCFNNILYDNKHNITTIIPKSMTRGDQHLARVLIVIIVTVHNQLTYPLFSEEKTSISNYQLIN